MKYGNGALIMKPDIIIFIYSIWYEVVNNMDVLHVEGARKLKYGNGVIIMKPDIVIFIYSIW